MDPSLSDEKCRVVGTRQIVRMAAQGKLSLVYLATDADARIRHTIEQACHSAGVSMEQAPDMAQLGRACGISVGAAAAGLLKPQ